MKDRDRLFLSQIMVLYRRGGQPIHYHDVAEKMGISSWSAYDALLGLSKGGFLERVFSQKHGPGRSRVLFKPTKEGLLSLQEKKGGDLISAILAVNFAIMIAHSCIPQILNSLAPKAKIAPSVIKEFAEKLFDGLSKAPLVAEIETGLNDKIVGLKKQFSKCASKLSKHEMVVLADVVSGLLCLRHQFGFERS